MVVDSCIGNGILQPLEVENCMMRGFKFCVCLVVTFLKSLWRLCPWLKVHQIGYSCSEGTGGEQ